MTSHANLHTSGKDVSLVAVPGIEISRLLIRDSFRTVAEAEDVASGESVRLTVFSEQLSQSAGFRRALKTDRGMLESLRHQAIPTFREAGEADGHLYFLTQACPSQTALTLLNSGRRLSTDDVIEVGWQVCSALQHAHNLGLSHGGLSARTILLSDDMQVTLVDFGVRRWLNSAESDKSDPAVAVQESSKPSSVWRLEVEQDLRDLAGVLSELMMDPQDESAQSEINETGPDGLGIALARVLERIRSLNGESTHPLSARDMQGCLGELLIGGGSDQIRLVDQREHPVQSRRSIVDELFEPGSSADRRNAGPANDSARSVRRSLQILPIVLVVLLVIILFVLAGLAR